MNFNHEERMLMMLYNTGTRLGLIHELRLMQCYLMPDETALPTSDLSSSVYHTAPHCKRVYVRRPQAAKVSPGEIPARQTPHRSAASAFR